MTPLTTSRWRARPLTPILGTTVGGVLGAAAWRAPDRVALIDGDRRWTYGELLAEAERVARALLTRFEPGEPVAVWAGNCPEWVILEFAAGLAGLTLVTVNPAYQAEELAHVLGHSGARGVFLSGGPQPAILDRVRDSLPRLREVITLGEWPPGDGGPLPEVDPASPAQILYTSGTTGRPKAAVLTHRGLTNNARLAAEAIGLRAGDVLVNPMPYFHVAGGAMITLGRPLPQTEVKITDLATGATVPCGTVGEICTRGYLVMDGYLGDPEATAAAIDPDGWLHTGDLGSMDERGYCRIAGRIKEMIIRGGENIYPREIEAVLLSHPGVAEVAVIGVPDRFWGEVVGAVVRPASGVGEAELAQDELAEHCRARLAAYKTPVRWLFTDAFPLTSTGKIRKDVLSAQLAEAGLAEAGLTEAGQAPSSASR